jgi:putative SOS response-associated peptidase YedK
MCNLYSYTKGQAAIRELARALRDDTGNLPLLPAIFPDTMAPVVRTARDGVREIAMMRWGFPPPPALGNRPVTNVRNTASPYWRGWLKAEFRCLVPASSFCEWADTKPRKTPTWFALSQDRPPFFFAGIWRPWTGERKGEAGEHRLFSFLTTDANAEVGAVHPKAMPVLLTGPEAVEAWMTAPVEEALRLARPLPDGSLHVVAMGETQDGTVPEVGMIPAGRGPA